MDKQEILKCGSCGKEKPDVKTVIDPYDADVNDDVHEVNLCDECYQNSCDDI